MDLLALLCLLYLLVLATSTHAVRSAAPLSVRTPLRKARRGDVPEEALAYLEKEAGALESAGFRRVGFVHAETPYAVWMLFLQHPETGDQALIYIASVRWADIVTDFGPDRGVTTSNLSRPSTQPVHPDAPSLRLPGVRDLGHLYRLHRRHLALRAPRDARVLLAPRAGAIAYLEDSITQSVLRQAEMGTCEIDGTVQRPTWRGALRAVLTLMPPSSLLVQAFFRMRARLWQARLERTEEAPVWPLEIRPDRGEEPEAVSSPRRSEPRSHLLTRADFEERAARAQGLTLARGKPLFLLGGALFLLGLGSEWLSLPEPVGTVVVGGFVLAMMGSLFQAVRAESAVLRELGLACPVCQDTLPGGKNGHVTLQVAESGRCTSCDAQVLRDVVTKSTSARQSTDRGEARSSARLLRQDELTRRVHEVRLAAERRSRIGLGVSMLIFLSPIGLILLGAGRQLLMVLMPLGLLFMIGYPFAGLALARRHAHQVGLGCPECRKPLVTRQDASVLRTRCCPHCRVRVVEPARHRPSDPLLAPPNP